MADSATSPFSLSTAITRGAFLACSWTWCIGMFFPVYLIKDFGWPGWVVFAIPNCIGAWAVGWWWRRPGSSEGFVDENRAATLWFSIVTICFHVCFLGWLITGVLGDGLNGGSEQSWTMELAVPCMAVLAAWGLSNASSRLWMRAAVIVFVISLVCGVLGFIGGGLSRFGLPDFEGSSSHRELIWATAPIVLGFLFCPHLDLTFHRTRQETPDPSGTAAFGVSFFAMFPLLVTMTLFYSVEILHRWFSAWIVIHIVMQSTFTMGAHLRELQESGIFTKYCGLKVTGALFVGLAMVVGSLLLGRSGNFRPGYPYYRLAYELFMSMYGLVFPAYIWIVSIPRGIPMKPRLAGWICSLLLAAPCFWLGYIEQRFAWLPVGVGVVLLMPWVVRGIAPKKA